MHSAFRHWLVQPISIGYLIGSHWVKPGSDWQHTINVSHRGLLSFISLITNLRRTRRSLTSGPAPPPIKGSYFPVHELTGLTSVYLCLVKFCSINSLEPVWMLWSMFFFSHANDRKTWCVWKKYRIIPKHWTVQLLPESHMYMTRH